MISSCVISLTPGKPQVWREVARVLEPGGRVAGSDMALLRPLPAQVAELVEALVGCVAGAVLVSDTERIAGEAGLTNVRLNWKKGYVAAMTGWTNPLYQKTVKDCGAPVGGERAGGLHHKAGSNSGQPGSEVLRLRHACRRRCRA